MKLWSNVKTTVLCSLWTGPILQRLLNSFLVLNTQAQNLRHFIVYVIGAMRYVEMDCEILIHDSYMTGLLGTLPRFYALTHCRWLEAWCFWVVCPSIHVCIRVCVIASVWNLVTMISPKGFNGFLSNLVERSALIEEGTD